ncbi:MAG: hypothetical protein R3E84_21565 [Pseudomonadales bacterium]
MTTDATAAALAVTLLLSASLTGVQPAAADTYSSANRNTPKPFDQASPACQPLAERYRAETREIEATAEQLRSTTFPASQAVVKEVTALTRKRDGTREAYFTCERLAGEQMKSETLSGGVSQEAATPREEPAATQTKEPTQGSATSPLDLPPIRFSLSGEPLNGPSASAPAAVPEATSPLKGEVSTDVVPSPGAPAADRDTLVPDDRDTPPPLSSPPLSSPPPASPGDRTPVTVLETGVTLDVAGDPDAGYPAAQPVSRVFVSNRRHVITTTEDKRSVSTSLKVRIVDFDLHAQDYETTVVLDDNGRYGSARGFVSRGTQRFGVQSLITRTGQIDTLSDIVWLDLFESP